MRTQITQQMRKFGLFLGLPLGIGLLSFVMVLQFTQSRNQSTVAAQSCDADMCVSLQQDGALPGEIAVQAGSVVQFNSADGKSHNLSLGKGGDGHDHAGPFHSGEFAADEAWKVQFKEDGTYYFHDHLNPDINVLVVVYTEGKGFKLENEKPAINSEQQVDTGHAHAPGTPAEHEH